jgi:hypothetical protein
MKDTNSKLSALHEARALIRTSRSQIFEILADVPRWQEWQPEVKLISKEHLSVYDSFKWSDGGMPIQSRVTNFISPELIVWESRSLWFKATTRWTLEMHEDGTLVYFEQTLEGFGAQMIKPMMVKSMDLTMAQLVKYAEHVPDLVYS